MPAWLETEFWHEEHDAEFWSMLYQSEDINGIEENQAIIHGAAQFGSPNAIKALKKAGADVNLLSMDNGYRPLHFACIANKFENIIALLEAGADIDAPDEHGNTSLYQAIHHCNVEAVKTILSYKGSVDILDTNGQTMLHVAVKNRGQHGVEIIKALLSSGADPNALTPNGRAPLHECPYHLAVPILIQWGAKIELKTWEGYTPLHIACKNGQGRLIKALIDAGANKAALTRGGELPYSFLVRNTNEIDNNIVRELMKIQSEMKRKKYKKPVKPEHKEPLDKIATLTRLQNYLILFTILLMIVLHIFENFVYHQ